MFTVIIELGRNRMVEYGLNRVQAEELERVFPQQEGYLVSILDERF